MFETVISGPAGGREDRVAYVNGAFSVTYRGMAEDIARCALWLRSQKIAEGDRVALHVGSQYRHWILFFAVEALGAISVPAWTGRALNNETLGFLGASFYATSLAPTEALNVRGAVLDRGWFRRLRTLRPAKLPARKRSGDDPVCVVISSGTTGIPKKVLFTRRQLDRRVFTPETADLIHASSRVLVELPIISIGALSMGLSTWAVGGVVCMKDPDLSWENMLLQYDPTLITAAPSHYAQMLATLPPGFKPRRPIHAAIGGGQLHPDLGAAVVRTLLGGSTMIYGSTEMGYATRGDDLVGDDERAVGFPWAWTELEIRDPDGRRADPGTIGEVWVRGEHVVGGYLEDTASGSSGFKDGWFHPGDLGSLREDGMLLIHGRTDDLINLRGAKMLPSDIEANVRRRVSVQDVAVFLAFAPGSRDPLLWIACVAEPRFAPDALARAIPKDGDFMLAFLDAIPRNAMGKIERAVLRERAENGTLEAIRVPHPDRGRTRDTPLGRP